ncbi:MAG: NADH-quinone oxidoreductase subunit A [Deltaproteobacteria bacterium]|nr:NADH-quinone oxidoreductase subunit A [Deltaproteobacteria bacterium]
MLLSYLPILIMIGFASFMGVMALFMSFIMQPKNPYKEKLTPWECGMEPVGDANTGHFRIHFFIIAILFIVFDVETLFLFPWAVILTDHSISMFLFVEMFVFIAVLAVGLIYAWVKGALEWI